MSAARSSNQWIPIPRQLRRLPHKPPTRFQKMTRNLHVVRCECAAGRLGRDQALETVENHMRGADAKFAQFADEANVFDSIFQVELGDATVATAELVHQCCNNSRTHLWHVAVEGGDEAAVVGQQIDAPSWHKQQSVQQAFSRHSSGHVLNAAEIHCSLVNQLGADEVWQVEEEGVQGEHRT